MKIPFRGVICWRVSVSLAMGVGVPLYAPSPALAQAVVQPLPSPAVGALDAALRRLAADPRNVQALIDAGYAALALNDSDAAIGFFSRASEIAPQNARAKAGLGSAFVRSENPYDAMLLFEEALRLGATPASLAADRGLASDLVGDASGAQAFYRQALTAGQNDEITRRLALSFAVSGKRNEMEDALLPLLKKSDLAAFRTRAFGLAILGDAKEASDIVDAIMPKEMAKRFKPYLKQLPRLTPAQQIAAASFGHFPAEKNIGSDDPRVARYGATAVKTAVPPIRSADAGLIPAGEPLGAKGKVTPAGKVENSRRDHRRAAGSGEQLAVATQPSRHTVRTVKAATTPALAPARATRELPPVPRPGFSPSVTAPASQSPAPLPGATFTSDAPASRSAQPAGDAPSAKAAVARPAFDLRNVSQSHAAPVAAAAVVPSSAAPPAAPASTAAPQPASLPAAPIYSPVPAVQPAVAATPAAPPPAALQQNFGSVADAFAGFAVATPPVTVLPGAVDLTTIKVAREAPLASKPDLKAEADKLAKDKAAKDKAAKEKLVKDKAAREKAAKEKAKKTHPSRIWVQVGTGRDKGALAFTWRKMSKEDAALFKGRKPYVSEWGQTNRLLTGPFPSDTAARDFLKKLKAANYDSFAFTSAEGQEVEVLAGSR